MKENSTHFFFFSVRNRILYLSLKMKDMSCLLTTLKAIFTYLCRNVVNLNQMTSDIRSYTLEKLEVMVHLEKKQHSHLPTHFLAPVIF